MQKSDWKKEICTIPNLLSLFRLLLIPVYIYIYMNATKPEHYWIASGILAVSCITDLVDGKIAKFGTVAEVINKETLSEIYKVDFEMIHVDGKPLSVYY